MKPLDQYTRKKKETKPFQPIGRYVEEARFRFSGDLPKAQLLKPLARKFLGMLLNDAQFNGLKQAQRLYKLSGGVVIAVLMYAGMVEAQIHVPPQPLPLDRPLTEMVTGFIVNVSLTDDYIWRNGFTGDEFTNEFDAGSSHKQALGLWAYGIEPNADKDVPENWMYSRVQTFMTGTFWDQDEIQPIENGMMFWDAFHFNGKEVQISESWEAASVIQGEHGARLASLSDPDCAPELGLLFGPDDPCITVLDDSSGDAATAASEQDALWGSVDQSPYNYDFKFWSASQSGIGHGNTTDNHFMCWDGFVVSKDNGYVIQAGAIDYGPTDPFLNETQDPVFDGVQNNSFILIPPDSSLSVEDATGQYDVSKVEVHGYDTDNGDPDQIQPDLISTVWAFYDQQVETRFLKFRDATIPTEIKAGDYSFKIETAWVSQGSRTRQDDADGKEVSVRIKLFGVQYIPSEYEFKVKTGELNDLFDIKVNVPITLPAYRIEEAIGFFINKSTTN